jgi:hypothetical protein
MTTTTVSLAISPESAYASVADAENTSLADNTNGTTELERQWEYVHGVIIPRLHPGQRVLLVPGLFASDPLHCLLHDNVTCPLDKQEEQVLAKIQGYIAWMKADVMIAGFKGWVR